MRPTTPESELIDGINCPIHLRPVEQLEEENWFFRLSSFAQPLLDWYEAHPDAVAPEGKRNEALGIIRQGLADISISRVSIDWGVTVPWDPAHVFYVWYDALINYATAVGYGRDPQRFEHWWPAVHHLIGKDILRFHCVYWPALLMAAGLEPPAHVNVHGFLLVGGAKMSKSGLGQIYPAELVADFGVDGFRHHFLHDVPFGPDGEFSYEGMVARYNADLANNLGNLLSRTATVVARKCDGIGPAPRPDSPLAAVAGRGLRRGGRGLGGGGPVGGAGSHLAAAAGDQRPSGGQRALEGRPRPRARRRAGRRPGGAAHRGHPGHPGHPTQLRRALAPTRTGRLAGRPAAARGRGVGRLSRRAGRREGCPAVPRSTPADDRPDDRRRRRRDDALDRQPLPPAGRARRPTPWSTRPATPA